jgi:hypothetical protein
MRLQTMVKQVLSCMLRFVRIRKLMLTNERLSVIIVIDGCFPFFDEERQVEDVLHRLIVRFWIDDEFKKVDTFKIANFFEDVRYLFDKRGQGMFIVLNVIFANLPTIDHVVNERFDGIARHHLPLEVELSLLLPPFHVLASSSGSSSSAVSPKVRA